MKNAHFFPAANALKGVPFHDHGEVPPTIGDIEGLDAALLLKTGGKIGYYDNSPVGKPSIMDFYVTNEDTLILEKIRSGNPRININASAPLYKGRTLTLVNKNYDGWIWNFIAGFKDTNGKITHRLPGLSTTVLYYNGTEWELESVNSSPQTINATRRSMIENANTTVLYEYSDVGFIMFEDPSEAEYAYMMGLKHTVKNTSNQPLEITAYYCLVDTVGSIRNITLQTGQYITVIADNRYWYIVDKNF